MILEKEKRAIAETGSKSNIKNWLIKALCPNKLADILLNSSPKEIKNLTLYEAIGMLRHPESSSLHITDMTNFFGKVPEAMVLEPLTRFGKTDKELLELILVKEGEYLLQLFDRNNSLLWSETRFSVVKEK